MKRTKICTFSVSTHNAGCAIIRRYLQNCVYQYLLLPPFYSCAKLYKDLIHTRLGYIKSLSITSSKRVRFQYMLYPSKWKLSAKFALKIPYILVLFAPLARVFHIIISLILTAIQLNWCFTQKKEKTMENNLNWPSGSAFRKCMS